MSIQTTIIILQALTTGTDHSGAAILLQSNPTLLSSPPLPHSHKHTPCQALTNRLKGYHDQTVPIVEHYRPKGIVNTLNGDQKPAEVSAALATLLEGAFPA